MSLPLNTGAVPKTPMDSPLKNALEPSLRARKSAEPAANTPDGNEKRPTGKSWRSRNKKKEKKKLQRDEPKLPDKEGDSKVKVIEIATVPMVKENCDPIPKPDLPPSASVEIQAKTVKPVQPAPYVEKPYPVAVQVAVPKLSGQEKYLCDANYVELLKTRSVKHPRAAFKCNLCAYYCDTLLVVKKHVSEKRHKDSLQVRTDEITLSKLPEPSQGQIARLTDLVIANYSLRGLTYAHRDLRRDIAKRLDAFVCASLPSCSVRLYGSSETCLGLQSSDVNLDLVVPVDHLLGPAKVMLTFAELIAENADYSVLQYNLNANLPAIVICDNATKLTCVVCLNNDTSYETTGLLACYESIDPRVKQLAAMFRVWAAECLLDKVNLGTWPPYAFSLLLVYYLQQMENPVLPVLHDLTAEENPDNKPSIFLHPSQLAGKWECKNTMSLGELWVKLFKFYAWNFAISERIVCIQQLEPLLRATKKWTGKKLAIEDPFLSKRNVSRTIVNMVTYDFILHCLRTSYKYYAIPQMEAGPMFGAIAILEDPESYGPEFEITYRRALDDMERILTKEPEFSAKIGQIHLPGQNYERLIVTPKIAEEMCQKFNCSLLYYVMRRDKFWGDQVLPMVCISCNQEGHVMENCPEEELPPPEILPPMTDQMVCYLNDICATTFRKQSPTLDEIKYRQEIVNKIEAFLVETDPQIKLELFGSSCNGFGLVRSDLDICLTFRDNATGDKLNFARIIDEISVKFRKYKELKNMVAITTAKVPILKFSLTTTNLEGDISVYNTLAQRNTKMLRAYADIDIRVRMLGFMIKKFAKMCDICDASRGSLSSYAYILMVIYFLQKCDPPVLPVLQQLHVAGTEPAPIVIENCNTYFYEDVANIAQVWPGSGRNVTPVGLLWHQLLCYYAETFSYKTDVVSIRQAATLTRFEKLWNTKSVAIEDPFDQTHNLGAALSRKMHMYIIKAFRKGRKHFGTPVILNEQISLAEYFFNQKYLVDGAPPNDRGCRVCKKIGHQVKDCPSKRASQEWKQQKKLAASNQLPSPFPGQRGAFWRNRGGGGIRSMPHHQGPMMNGMTHLPPGLNYPVHQMRSGHLLERFNAQVPAMPHHLGLSQQEIARIEQIRHVAMMSGKFNRNNWQQ